MFDCVFVSLTIARKHTHSSSSNDNTIKLNKWFQYNFIYSHLKILVCVSNANIPHRQWLTNARCVRIVSFGAIPSLPVTLFFYCFTCFFSWVSVRFALICFDLLCFALQGYTAECMCVCVCVGKHLFLFLTVSILIRKSRNHIALPIP